MNRIDKIFKDYKDKQKALIPYILAGDPNLEASLQYMHQAVASGADMLEVGIPFTDPVADGPVIQAAHERALEQQVSLLDVLELVEQFRQDNQETPIILMGYANPIEWMGYDVFADKAKQVGVDGVLVVDEPPEESHKLYELLSEKEIALIFLLAPTSNEDRIKKVCELGRGYIYYVSLKGVTGASLPEQKEIAEQLSRITAHTDLPICVGFGIKDTETAKTMAEICDGVIVGSSLITKITASKTHPNQSVGEYIQSLKQAIA